MLKCHIIKDLLPNYIDELLSEETQVEVEQHLKECPNCQLEYENMKSTENVPLPSTTNKEVDYLKKVRRKSWYMAISFLAVGVLIGITGIYIGEIDDAPGAALIGILFMLCLAVLGLKAVWHRQK